MRPRFAGRTTARKGRLAPALIAAAALLAIGLSVPSIRMLRDVESARKADTHLAIAVDLDDVHAFVPEPARDNFFSSLKDVPVSLITVRDTLSPAEESQLRSAGFHLLWRLGDGADSGAFPGRLGPADGTMVTGEFALESPGMAEALAAAVRRNNGFLALVELAPTRPLLHLPALLDENLIRAHIITTRETIWPKPDLWTPRLLRAVRDRWVRLVSFRFSSTWDPKKNVAFLTDVAHRLKERGYEIGPPVPLRPWREPFARAATAALLLAVLAPAAAMAGLSRRSDRGALVPYTIATAWCTAAGIVVHGLIATPSAVLGLEAARGVKLQLVVPMLLSAAVLLDRDELFSFFRRKVSWGDLTLAGMALGGGLALYLMRSGNDPIVKVTDAERGFRDVLESLLGARPRFKEFAIGHPLLIAGLYLRGRGRGFFRDGRVFMLLGAIGQISVVNTFVHAPAPLSESLLRTFNGWWIGALIALPFCHALNLTGLFHAPDRDDLVRG